MRWILAVLIVLCIASVANSQTIYVSPPQPVVRYEQRVCIYPVVEYVEYAAVVPTIVLPPQPLIIRESPAPVLYLSPPPYYVVPHYVYTPRVWVHPKIYVEGRPIRNFIQAITP